MKATFAVSLLLLPVAWAQTTAELPAPASLRVEFDRDVKPILASKCFGCHGATQQQSGLRLDKKINALRGGDYGVVIVPGKSAESTLILRLAGSQFGIQMPPTGPLSPEEIGILRAWIDQGALYPDTVLADLRQDEPVAVDPKVRDLFGAIRGGRTAVVRSMVAVDKSLVEARDHVGATALIYAALHGTVDCMRLLLDAGADVNARSRRSATALLWASSDVVKVRLLLERGADPNAHSVEGRSPLLFAAGQNTGAELVKLLLEKGADPNQPDIAGRTPLMAAAGAGAVESVKLLIAKGAKVNARAETGTTALIGAAGSRSLSCVQLLIDHGADVKAANKRGVTALSAAASWGALDIVKLLLAKGADVNTKDVRGWTPLMNAAYSDSHATEVVELLLASGADPEATGEGETALSLAKKRGETSMVGLFAKARK